MNLKVIVYVLFLVLFSVGVSSLYTVQSSADNITFVGGFTPLSGNFTDGNYATWTGDGNPLITRSDIYENYTNTGYVSALLDVKTYCNRTNISLSSCDITNTVRLRYNSHYRTDTNPDQCQAYISCWNGTGDSIIYVCKNYVNGCEEHRRFYESDLFWYTAPAATASDFSTPLLTFGILVLLVLGFVVSKKEYSKYAVAVLLLGGVGFGLWFLISVIG